MMRTKTLASVLVLCASTAAVAQVSTAPIGQDVPANNVTNDMMDEPSVPETPMMNETPDSAPDEAMPDAMTPTDPVDEATPADPVDMGPPVVTDDPASHDAAPETMGDDTPPTR